MAVEPTQAMRPFWRQSSAASASGSLLSEAAVTATKSTPWPAVAASFQTSKSSPGRPPHSAPWSRAAFTRAGSRSMPSTRQPLARSSWTESWPSRPRPITAPISPSVGVATRTPCSAIAPSVAKAALRSSTSSGTRTTRFSGTATHSAWFA